LPSNWGSTGLWQESVRRTEAVMIKADPNLDVPPASRRAVGTALLVMRTCEHGRAPEPRRIYARECEPLSPSMLQARKRRKKLGGG
jgi:hypothetical protein